MKDIHLSFSGGMTQNVTKTLEPNISVINNIIFVSLLIAIAFLD